jgi:GNAT superfamily N-acetyltransferase
LGLLPRFTGKGIGKYMTSSAIQHALESGAKLVWLSTCSFDHPAALKTYLKQGFKIVREETVRKDFPDK